MTRLACAFTSANDDPKTRSLQPYEIASLSSCREGLGNAQSINLVRIAEVTQTLCRQTWRPAQ